MKLHNKLSDKISYSSDASGLSKEPDFVVFPKSAEDIIEAIKLAISQNKNIVPRGAGTGLAGGVVPIDNSIILDLSRMNKISNLDIKNQTVEAGPGVVLDDLNNYLAEYNLELPIKPGSHKAATIGGMCATNAAGMHAVKYGNIINWVEQIEFVDGNGKIHKISRESLKDVVGREGVTGVISRIKFKVQSSKFKKTSTFVIPRRRYDDEGSLRQGGKYLAIEYIDNHSAHLLDLNNSCILVESEEKIEDAEEISSDIWQRRDNLWPLLAQEGYYIIEDPWIPQEKIGEFIDWLKKNNIPTFGHLGVGVLHPCFKDGQEDLIRQMYDIVVKLNGKVTGEHGIGLRKREFVDSEFRKEILELKKKYDPKGILNRGKLI